MPASRIPSLFTPRLRQARAGDGPGCHQVFYRAVHEGTVNHYSPEERQAWAPDPTPSEAFETTLLQHFTIVATRHGKPIGFMSMGADGHLDLAYVSPDWMGHGIADKLYESVLRHSDAERIPILTTDASFLFRQFLLRRGWTSLARQSVIRRGVAIPNFRMQLERHY